MTVHSRPASRVRMHWWRNTAAAASASAIVLVSGCAGTGDGGYQLSLADWIAPTHVFSEEGATFFIETVEEMSGGEIQFEHYPAEQMGGGAELPELLESGVTDIASIAPAYVPSDFPLSSVSDLPGLVSESCEGSHAIMKTVAEGGILFEEEYSSRGLVPLFVALSTKYEVFTKSKKVSSPDDMTGLQIRSGGGAQDRTLAELGAAPIAMTGSEMYEAIQRGTVDGIALNALTVLPYNLQEVVEYGTVGVPVGNFTAVYAMNRDSFEALPTDVQEVFLQAGQDTTDNVCAAIEKQNQDAYSVIEGEGVELFELSDSEQADWSDAVEPVIEGWAHDVGGEDVVESFQKALTE